MEQDEPSQFAPPDGLATRLLRESAEGDDAARDRLFQLVYTQLRVIADRQLRQERRDHTLQATALVHEAYLRLVGRQVEWGGQAHFLHAASEAMRRILIDHARARGAAKRGGGRAALRIDSVLDLAATPDPEGILALDGAISRLEEVDAQAALVVRLRLYAGVGTEAVAEALGVSVRTVGRDWAFARAWLRKDLEGETD